MDGSSVGSEAAVWEPRGCGRDTTLFTPSFRGESPPRHPIPTFWASIFYPSHPIWEKEQKHGMPCAVSSPSFTSGILLFSNSPNVFFPCAYLLYAESGHCALGMCVDTCSFSKETKRYDTIDSNGPDRWWGSFVFYGVISVTQTGS